MTPFASGKRWTLYAGDCLEVLRAGLLPREGSIIADPPYGMNWNAGNKKLFGRKVRWEPIQGDDVPFDPSPWLGFPWVVLWGAHHYAQRLPVGTLLIWVKKPDSQFGTMFSDADIAWCKGGHGVYCHRLPFPTGTRIREAGLGGRTAHPNQKPVALMRWCIQRAKVPEGGLVLDPYAGSGTTGVAALEMGLDYIGVECDPAFLDVAVGRLRQAESA